MWGSAVTLPSSRGWRRPLVDRNSCRCPAPLPSALQLSVSMSCCSLDHIVASLPPTVWRRKASRYAPFFFPFHSSFIPVPPMHTSPSCQIRLPCTLLCTWLSIPFWKHLSPYVHFLAQSLLTTTALIPSHSCCPVYLQYHTSHTCCMYVLYCSQFHVSFP